MSDWPVLLLANGAVAAGAAVQGLAGFGMNLVALPLLFALDPDFVPVPLLIAHLVLVLVVSSTGWRSVDRAILGSALAGAVPGTVLGAMAVLAMSLHTFQVFTLAVLLAGIAVTALELRIPRSPLSAGVAGVLCGFCGTTTSINGPPLGVVLAGSSAARDGGSSGNGENLRRMRATMAVFLLTSTVLSLAALALAGRIGQKELLVSATLVPGTLAGLTLARLGARRLAHVLSPRRLFLGASLISTTILAVSILR